MFKQVLEVVTSKEFLVVLLITSFLGNVFLLQEAKDLEFTVQAIQKTGAEGSEAAIRLPNGKFAVSGRIVPPEMLFLH